MGLVGLGVFPGLSAHAQNSNDDVQINERAKTLGAPDPASKIAPEVLDETAGGNNTSVVILLTDQADVSAAYSIKDQDVRGWFVYKTLTKHAARSQAELKTFLRMRG